MPRFLLEAIEAGAWVVGAISLGRLARPSGPDYHRLAADRADQST